MDSLKKGWKLVAHSLAVFWAYPVFLLPLLAVWAVYAAGVLYLRYSFDWKALGVKADIGVLFAFLFLLSFLILMSFALVLEMIRQAESGRPSFVRALGEVIARDMISVLPLALVWAIIWLALTLLEIALSSKNKESDSDRAMNAQNAAETLANFDHFSFSEAFIGALEKGVRMVVFLILPAIAWEDLGFFKGTKKGLAVLRAHLKLFVSGYALTYAAAMVAFMPAAIMMTVGTGRHGHPPLVHFPDYAWVALIIYMGFAWSLSLYLEQMFMAQLYQWHMAWQEAAAKATSAGEKAPSFDMIPQPDLLSRTPGLFAQSPVSD